MIRIRISDDAIHDLNLGFLFYDSQEPGLGDYFTTCLKADIEGLRITAGAHPVVHADFHRLLGCFGPSAESRLDRGAAKGMNSDKALGNKCCL